MNLSKGFRPECHNKYIHRLARKQGVPIRKIDLQMDLLQSNDLRKQDVNINIEDRWWRLPEGNQALSYVHKHRFSVRFSLTNDFNVDIIKLTHMRPPKPPRLVDNKAATLREQGALHPHPEVVQDEAFRSQEFFDPRDLVQVRYEMLRRHRIERRPVTEVATSFGVSRQAFYVTEATYQSQGLPGLFPRRRGPKRAHKCTEEVLNFVEQWREAAKPETGETVVHAIENRFGVRVNPRSIDRALARRKKKHSPKWEGGK